MGDRTNTFSIVFKSGLHGSIIGLVAFYAANVQLQSNLIISDGFNLTRFRAYLFTSFKRHVSLKKLRISSNDIIFHKCFRLHAKLCFLINDALTQIEASSNINLRHVGADFADCYADWCIPIFLTIVNISNLNDRTHTHRQYTIPCNVLYIDYSMIFLLWCVWNMSCYKFSDSNMMTTRVVFMQRMWGFALFLIECLLLVNIVTLHSHSHFSSVFTYARHRTFEYILFRNEINLIKIKTQMPLRVIGPACWAWSKQLVNIHSNCNLRTIMS